MTVSQLIEKLSKMNPDAKVLVNGYEGGCDPASEPQSLRVKKREKFPPYEGQYDAEDNDGDIDAVLIGGQGNRD